MAEQCWLGQGRRQGPVLPEVPQNPTSGPSGRGVGGEPGSLVADEMCLLCACWEMLRVERTAQQALRLPAGSRLLEQPPNPGSCSICKQGDDAPGRVLHHVLRKLPTYRHFHLGPGLVCLVTVFFTSKFLRANWETARW